MKRPWLLLIAFPFPALIAGCANWHQMKMEAAEALYERGVKSECLILDKNIESRSGTKGSWTKYYRVKLDRPAGPVERYVSSGEFDRIERGDVTTWSEDRVTGEGVAQVELSYHQTDFALLLAVALLSVAILLRSWWMALPGGSAEGRVKRGGEGGPQAARPKLPPVERPADKRWERWQREKHFPPGRILAVPAIGFAALGLPAFLLGWGTLGGVVLFHAGCGGLTIFLSRWRARRRDRILWSRGVEVAAKVEKEKAGSVIREIEAAYTYDGTPYLVKQRIPASCSAKWGGGKEAVVLVDPRNPKRATIVPEPPYLGG